MESWREELYSNLDASSELYHHGILGQRWGIRRFQNKDGTLTEDGRKRYLKGIRNAHDGGSVYDSKNKYHKAIMESISEDKLNNIQKHADEAISAIDSVNKYASNHPEKRDAIRDLYDYYDLAGMRSKTEPYTVIDSQRDSKEYQDYVNEAGELIKKSKEKYGFEGMEVTDSRIREFLDNWSDDEDEILAIKKKYDDKWRANNKEMLNLVETAFKAEINYNLAVLEIGRELAGHYKDTPLTSHRGVTVENYIDRVINAYVNDAVRDTIYVKVTD